MNLEEGKMKISICHYSFHRRYVDEGWDLDRLCSEAAALDVDALDFHVRYLGDIKDAAKRVSAALKNSGLKLSGLSLSTNFNVPDKEKFQEEIKNTKAWMQVAAQTGAPVSRIFGGGLKRLETDEKTKSEAFKRVIEALGILSETAKEIGLVLALENHGGLPCTGEEQVEMLKAVGSDFVKATIDVGNYMAGGQEGVEGTKVAKDYCAYVHFKDNKKIPDPSKPWGWGTVPCIVGQGDVDHVGCLKILKEAGYNGYIALEYEGREDESVGVPESVAYMKKVIKEVCG
jgi:sugar phosphate isomerase/epimerase